MPDRRLSNQGGHDALCHTAALAPATPLWQRVPTRDDDGALLSDFMMLIPGLRQRPSAEQGRLLARVDDVLRVNRHVVVFAECSLKLNLLWVSVRAVPGICRDLADALIEAVPEARLVAPEGPATRRPRGDT
jgi:hypothetical protein